MSTIQSQSQTPQRRNQVKNILARYSSNKEVKDNHLTDKNYQHPENAYLAKYSPKYYQSLMLLMKPQNRLLSKIKKIKKLKRFSGNFNNRIPQANWFKILANNRKEVEEFPGVYLFRAQRLFWAKTALHAVKFFSQIRMLQLPTYKSDKLTPQHNFLAIWGAFSVHLKNMRRLEILKICTNKFEKSEAIKSLFQKLNGMQRLLGKLQALKCSFQSDSSREILQNENLLSSLTDLKYVQIPLEAWLIRHVIPQTCENPKSLPIGLLGHISFQSFILPMRELPKLRSISVDCSRRCSYDFWSYFLPPASLRNLKIKLNAAEMQRMNLFKDIIKCGNLCQHWKKIEKLDALELEIRCENSAEILFTKDFITAMLKKVSRLMSFTIRLNLNYRYVWRYEPFEIEKVPHLYEHLKKFKVKFRLDKGVGSVGFDFSFLKPFKNLKEISFQGYHCCWTNVADAICLLEKSVRSGELSTLKLGGMSISYPEELKDLLEKVSKAKKSGTNLKVVLRLEFLIESGTDDEIKYLGQLCEIIESKPVKGLEILLNMENEECSRSFLDEVKRVLGKYPGMRNFMLHIFDRRNTLEYIKRDGEKEQLLFREIVG